MWRHRFFLGSASVFPHAQGMFRETFAIGLHAVHRAGVLTGKTVLVTGGGTIGCMSTIAARLAGAAHVIVCDIADRPLEMARRVGADETVRSDQVDAKALADRADVALEAAGSPAALATCLAAIKRGGRIVQVGTLPAEIPFPANTIMARELDYVGAFRAAQAFDWAVQYLRTRRVDVRPLVSAQLPLSRAQEAFELAADRSRSTKVQLVAD